MSPARRRSIPRRWARPQARRTLSCRRRRIPRSPRIRCHARSTRVRPRSNHRRPSARRGRRSGFAGRRRTGIPRAPGDSGVASRDDARSVDETPSEPHAASSPTSANEASSWRWPNARRPVRLLMALMIIRIEVHVGLPVTDIAETPSADRARLTVGDRVRFPELWRQEL